MGSGGARKGAGRKVGQSDSVPRKYKHCFSRQYLDDFGIEITCGEELILGPVPFLYEIKLPNTMYYVGQTFREQGELQRISSYEVLREHGFVIISRRPLPHERWEKSQQVVYELKYKDEVADGEDLGQFPSHKYSAHAEYDSYNKVMRLVGSRCGRLGFGPWKPLDKHNVNKTNRGGSEIGLSGYAEHADEIVDNQIESWLGIEPDPEPIQIPEAAFMITDSNEIVCFPNTPDMPSILINGLKGCQVGDDVVWMADGTYKPIKDIKRGEKVLSPQRDGTLIEAEVVGTCKWWSEENYHVVDWDTYVKDQPEKTTILYTCSCNHRIPSWRRVFSNKKYFEPRADEIAGKFKGRFMYPQSVPVPDLNIFPVDQGVLKADPNWVYGITLNSKSQWYITNEGIVTHNTGKSFCLHSLVSRFFWKPKYDYKIVILNDSSRETGTWCFPNSDPDLIRTLKKINEKPLPLPTVYLHPMVNEDYEKLYNKGESQVGFDITIPFKEIVQNHKEYLKLEGSARYFSQFREQLSICETQAEAEALLDTISVSHNVPPNTANKIRAEFDTLFDSGITDISHEKQKPWFVSKASDKPYNPITACVHAGVLPVIETEYISNSRELLSIYFSYFTRDIFMRQKQDEDFVRDKSEVMLVIDECFAPETKIATTDGPRTITSLYRDYIGNKKLPLAKSYNFKTEKFEWSPITKAMRQEKSDLLEIGLGVSKLKCTPNHSILTPKGYVKAEELKEGDLLSAHYHEDKKNLIRELSKDQKQIIYGSILGDGGLRHIKSGMYRMTLSHGLKQKSYLNWKRSFFNNPPTYNVFSPYTSGKTVISSNTRAFVLEGPVPKNSIPDWLIEKIDLKGIAIWFMDDGSNNSKSGCASIASYAYDYHTHLKLVDLFKRYGIEARIRFQKKRGGTKNGYFYLGFNKRASTKLYNLIAPYIHPILKYKINNVQGDTYQWDKTQLNKGYGKIKYIRPIKNKSPFVFNLTVEPHHNYVVCTNTTLNGIICKNCHNIAMKGQKSPADMLLRRCVREGRPRRIGTLIATQKFQELPDVIKDNTTYLLCFKNPGEANTIANQYKMGKNSAKLITDLDKHECLAYTTEYFIVYDSYGKKRKSRTNEIFTGKCLPPYSEHKRPTTTRKGKN